jgi:hypothetical protein
MSTTKRLGELVSFELLPNNKNTKQSDFSFMSNR